MNDGKIGAFDTFDNLMAHNEEFRTMMATVDVDQQDSAAAKEVDDSADVAAEKPAEDSEDSLMQEEERASENVGLKVYYRYFKASGSVLVLPLIFLFLIVAQGPHIVTNLWLTWWTSDKLGFPTGKYIGIYVALGVTQALTLFLFSVALSTERRRAKGSFIKQCSGFFVRPCRFMTLPRWDA
ncbi:hypothetical protein VTN00DRAFT_7705 [Thermoascus crustaceus]|uniref:uncharacterized protein n=1 Tax=Thermoascus crustaceus TaxID=5088 RepID=UPI0037432EB4